MLIKLDQHFTIFEWFPIVSDGLPKYYSGLKYIGFDLQNNNILLNTLRDDRLRGLR